MDTSQRLQQLEISVRKRLSLICADIALVRKYKTLDKAKLEQLKSQRRKTDQLLNMVVLSNKAMSDIDQNEKLEFLYKLYRDFK